MFNYTNLKKKILKKYKTKDNKLEIVVSNEIADLSDKEVRELYHNEQWIFADCGMLTGKIADWVRNELENILVKELK